MRLIGSHSDLPDAELIHSFDGAAIAVEHNFDRFFALHFTADLVFQLSDDCFCRGVDDLARRVSSQIFFSVVRSQAASRRIVLT